MAALAAMSFTFTSCDDPWDGWGYGDGHWENGHGNSDDYYISMANTIRGHWTGVIQVQTYDKWGNLVTNTLDTDFEFDQYYTNSTGGRGQEIDYRGEEIVYKSTFTWQIDTRTDEIIVKYDDLEQRDMIVFEYDLRNNSFTGTMDSRDGSERNIFNLTRYTYSKGNNTFEKE